MGSNEPGSTRAQGRQRGATQGQRKDPASREGTATHARHNPRSLAARKRARQQRQRVMYLAGGTIAVLVIILIVAIVRNTSSNGGPGLANASALAPAQKTLSNGTVAPDFTLATVDGKEYKLSSYRGHPVLLEFFAVWCPHCQNMAPVLENVQSQFSSKGLQELSVLANPYGRNYDSSGGSDTSLATASDVRWFQSNFSVQHPLLVDPNFVETNKYGAYSYPTIYVIDSKGVIQYSSYGEVTQATLGTAIQKALAS